MTNFAEAAGVNRTTSVCPDQPGAAPWAMRRHAARPRGSYKAYASAAGVDEQEAFDRLLVEEEVEDDLRLPPRYQALAAIQRGVRVATVVAGLQRISLISGELRRPSRSRDE